MALLRIEYISNVTRTRVSAAGQVNTATRPAHLRTRFTHSGVWGNHTQGHKYQCKITAFNWKIENILFFCKMIEYHISLWLFNQISSISEVCCVHNLMDIYSFLSKPNSSNNQTGCKWGENYRAVFNSAFFKVDMNLAWLQLWKSKMSVIYMSRPINFLGVLTVSWIRLG